MATARRSSLTYEGVKAEQKMYLQGSISISPHVLPESRPWGTGACPAAHHWWSGFSSAESHSRSPEAQWSLASPKREDYNNASQSGEAFASR